jgi:septum site-determining protein MinC
MKSNQQTSPAFQLKGSVFTLSVLQLCTLDYIAFQRQLLQTVEKNPNFFNHMPIVIDLQKLFTLDCAIDFVEINSLLRNCGLVPVGVINGNAKQVRMASEAGWGILPDVRTMHSISSAEKVENAKIVSQPVRSGQQIYAKHTDLIVLASVSNGAEILADGNIHVYGTLRGRAIAGACGEATARIFCHKLEAELVAIAGYYKLQEDIEMTSHFSTTQVFLEDNQLVVGPIN